MYNKICPVFRANAKETTKGDGLRPPPFVVSFALALNTEHILLLRRKTCALLRAKASALLRRKTCAVLRARTCALLPEPRIPPRLSLDVLLDFLRDVRNRIILFESMLGSHSSKNCLKSMC